MAFKLSPAGSRTQQKVICILWFGFVSALIFLDSPKLYSKYNSALTVSVMAYNVENLFDATDDGALQEDITYLPMSVKHTWKVDRCLEKEGFYRTLCQNLDWTQEKYEQKLKKIAQVLLSYDSKGADIIVLEELENKRVITDLWKKHLKSKKYKAPIHFESPSSRGIDVGIISRFPLTEPAIAHPVDLSDLPDHSTRDIIEARFELPSGEELRITANHWPSQNNSTQARLRAADVLKKIAEEAEKDEVSFVAAGDFNTTLEETPNPIDNNISDHFVNRPARPLVDVQDHLGSTHTYPPASHFYRGQWSPLDRLLASKDLFNGSGLLNIDSDSFEIYAPDYLFTNISFTDPTTGKERTYKAPFRFDFMTGEGYSDHLPVVVKLTQNYINN